MYAMYMPLLLRRPSFSVMEAMGDQSAAWSSSTRKRERPSQLWKSSTPPRSNTYRSATLEAPATSVLGCSMTSLRYAAAMDVTPAQTLG